MNREASIARNVQLLCFRCSLSLVCCRSKVLALLTLLACGAVLTVEANSRKAFYILFADDINSPTFPQGFSEFELFVVQPQNVTAQMIQKVKTLM